MIEYGSIATSYDERYTSDMCRAENEAVCELLNRYGVSSRRTLDVGCGTGFALDCIKIDRYLGVDISREMIEIARQKHPSCTFRAVPLQDVRVGMESVEVALCIFSIPYIGEDAAEILHGFLKPNGICICVYYNKPYLNPNSVYGGQKRMFDKDVRPKVKRVIRAFKRRFKVVEEHDLTEHGTYTVAVFKKEERK